MAVTAPNVDEQRNNRSAYAEGLDAAKKLPKEHLLKVIKTQKDEAEQATREQRALWSYWFDLWLNRIDYADKEDWQSQVWIPKTFASIEHGTSLIQRSLLDADRPFSIEPAGSGDESSKQLSTHVWTPLVELAFASANFPGLFTDATKMGFITGLMGYLKCRWTQTQVPILTGVDTDPDTGAARPVFQKVSRSFLSMEVIEPWKIFRDPVGSRARQNFSGSYLIHSETKQRPELQRMVKSGWDKDSVQRLLARKGAPGTGTATNNQQAEAERKDQAWSTHAFRFPYLIDEWWGDLLNENGDAILPDALMIAGDTEILAGPVENPLWATDRNTGRRKWPFIASAPIFHPTRFEGRGIAEQNADLSRLFSNLFCLFMDGLNWTVNPPTEVWQDALADFEDLGNYPGKLWIKKQQQQAIMPAVMGKMPVGEIMGALEYVDRQRQNSDFINDMVIGQPGSRSNITLGEVEIKTNESHGIFESIAKNMEMFGTEAVEMAQNFCSQYLWDFTDPAIVSVVGQHNAMYLTTLPPVERMRQLGGRFTYKFTGVSQAMYKDQMTKKVVQFAQLAASEPYATLIKTMRPAAYLEILLAVRDGLGLSDRIDLPDTAEFEQVMAQQAQMAAQQPPPGAPGQVPNGVGAPTAVPNSPAELLKQRPAGPGQTPNPSGPPATAVPNQMGGR